MPQMPFGCCHLQPGDTGLDLNPVLLGKKGTLKKYPPLFAPWNFTSTPPQFLGLWETTDPNCKEPVSCIWLRQHPLSTLESTGIESGASWSSCLHKTRPPSFNQNVPHELCFLSGNSQNKTISLVIQCTFVFHGHIINPFFWTWRKRYTVFLSRQSVLSAPH